MEKLSRKCILYVEDNTLLHNLLKLLLKSHELHCVETAEEALKLPSDRHYDLIIIDINLGQGMDGIQLCKLLRASQMHKKTPMIAMTASAYNEILPNIRPDMFNDYIGKPFSSDDIRNTVNFHLKHEPDAT
jgi:CheY-like chemotaxis protein